MSEPISIEHLSDKAKYDYGLVLKAIQNKDQHAFTELMDRYKDRERLVSFQTGRTFETLRHQCYRVRLSLAFCPQGQYPCDPLFEQTWTAHPARERLYSTASLIEREYKLVLKPRRVA